MVDSIDKETYFPRTFNEQMAWIDEEVEHIIKYDKRYQIKKKIQEGGKEAYGQMDGYTHAINRLFEIIKADPKNKALLREVDRAEQELIAFLYDEPGALPIENILTYWNDYMLAYVAELESQPVHYFIVIGYDNCHDEDQYIGIFHAWDKARDAYYKAVEALEKEHQDFAGRYGDGSSEFISAYTSTHEKVMINLYDEAAGKWRYDVDPALVFPNKASKDREKYKEIECVIDSAQMCQWKLDHTRKDRLGYRYIYDDSKNRGEETISVRFELEHTYEVFDLFDWYWGAVNERPDCNTMKKKAKEWHERYDAELIRISDAALTFKCHKLSEEEAREIIAEASALYAEIIDCKPEKLVAYMTRENTFTLWWD